VIGAQGGAKGTGGSAMTGGVAGSVGGPVTGGSFVTEERLA
jgi:hypothetical protein